MSLTLPNWLRKGLGWFGRRKPLSPRWLRLVRVVEGLHLLIVCAFLCWRILLYRDVREQFARLKTAGMPTSGAELNTWGQPPAAADNGALVLTQAFARLCSLPEDMSRPLGDSGLLQRTNQWSVETRALVKTYLETNAAALAKAHEALSFSRFRYPVDFTYATDTEFPHLGALKELARLAALRADLEAEAGHTEAWPGEVEFQLRLAQSLEEEPCVIAQLVRNAILRIAAKATERSLNHARASPPDAACVRLEAAFLHAGRTNLVPLALIGERAMVIPMFRLSWKEINTLSEAGHPGQSRPRQRLVGKPNAALWFMGLLERDLRFFLRAMETSLPLAAGPLPERLTLSNQMTRVFLDARRGHYFVADMVMPSISRLVDSDASARASIDLAITGLAIERFRRARGQAPADLGALTPEFLDAVPADPFDGAPLRYRRTAAGYVLYSIGVDGRDDGGRERPDHVKAGEPTSYDITFIVEH